MSHPSATRTKGELNKVGVNVLNRINKNNNIWEILGVMFFGVVAPPKSCIIFNVCNN